VLVLKLSPSSPPIDTTPTVPEATRSCNVAVIAPQTVVTVLVNVIVCPSEIVVSVSTMVMVLPPNTVTISLMLVVLEVGCGGGV